MAMVRVASTPPIYGRVYGSGVGGTGVSSGGHTANNGDGNANIYCCAIAAVVVAVVATLIARHELLKEMVEDFK